VPTSSDAEHDEDFLKLLSAYRCTGGIATGAEIASRPSAAGFLQLARHIAQRRVVNFVWRDEIWLPIFQFEAGGQTVQPRVQVLTDELVSSLEDWALAKWFVEPNTWLDGATPLAQIADDFDRVHGAARALRFAQPG
jgi:hypothetical protein